MIKKVKR